MTSPRTCSSTAGLQSTTNNQNTRTSSELQNQFRVPEPVQSTRTSSEYQNQFRTPEPVQSTSTASLIHIRMISIFLEYGCYRSVNPFCLEGFMCISISCSISVSVSVSVSVVLRADSGPTFTQHVLADPPCVHISTSGSHLRGSV